jgi:hypothetical protein
MPFPEATGWAGPQGQDFGAGADISQAVELYRQQQMMSGQQPIPEMGGMTTRQYLGMLAGSNPDLAGQFATAIGTDLQTIMGEAQAAGQYTNTPSNSLLGRAFGAVGDVGNFIQENPALIFRCRRGRCGWRWRGGWRWSGRSRDDVPVCLWRRGHGKRNSRHHIGYHRCRRGRSGLDWRRSGGSGRSRQRSRRSPERESWRDGAKRTGQRARQRARLGW